MRAIQGRWHTAPSPYPEERWFDSLELETVSTAGPAVAFAFRDRFGQRWGWRWRFAAITEGDPQWPELLAAHLGEELITGGWSLPDTEGVRWLQSGTH